jgi:hypothetical protein
LYPLGLQKSREDIIMDIYILITYVEECKAKGQDPTLPGLKNFRKTWRD